MKTNMGTVDRMIRFIVGLIMLILAFLILFGVWQIVLWVVGGILVLTAIVGICPLYLLFRFSTKKTKQ
jgi:uncharacterized membrane protein YkgB